MVAKTLSYEKEILPGNCVSYRLRRAARSAAKVYDGALKPIGLRNTQFTLLVSLYRDDAPSIGALSERLAIDGTTLTRNLEVLVRRGLVEDVAVEDARVRVIRLTRLGEQTYQKALPLWRKAQKHILDSIEPKQWKQTRAALGQIEAACNNHA